MKQKIKETYQAPTIKVLEIHFERFICQTSSGDSQIEVPGYGDETDI